MKDAINKATIIAFFIGGVLGGAAGGVAGFGLGIYYLPILVEAEGATTREVKTATKAANYKTNFRRDLKGSDSLHWGEGTLYLGREIGGQYYFTLDGQVSPGPDYKLYLAPRFVETEADFLAIKAQSVRVADINGFTNFRVSVPMSIDPTQYEAVVVWCETFSQFITAGTLRQTN
ncbi:MAG: DM13 domain-containing protein [Alphaproteobacteria bacterium]|nr:DM13 domain-containing protein [Alphaproteobacteria bacterium]MBE8220868.1 DM13 domain-containing protein [Alphaproteobacteria bacterium]